MTNIWACLWFSVMYILWCYVNCYFCFTLWSINSLLLVQIGNPKMQKCLELYFHFFACSLSCRQLDVENECNSHCTLPDMLILQKTQSQKSFSFFFKWVVWNVVLLRYFNWVRSPSWLLLTGICGTPQGKIDKQLLWIVHDFPLLVIYASETFRSICYSSLCFDRNRQTWQWSSRINSCYTHTLLQNTLWICFHFLIQHYNILLLENLIGF